MAVYLFLVSLVWGEGPAVMFGRFSPDGQGSAVIGLLLLLAIAALSLLTVAMTIGAEPLFELTTRGARQLLQRDEYVRAVLGGAP